MRGRKRRNMAENLKMDVKQTSQDTSETERNYQTEINSGKISNSTTETLDASASESEMATVEPFKVPDKITFQLPKSRKPDVSKQFATPQESRPKTTVQANVSEISEFKTDKSEGQPTGNSKTGESSVNGEKPQQNPQNISKKYAFPAQQLSQGTIPYKEPSWGGPCEEQYKFEVLKNGTILETVDLTTKSFHVFGRLPSCDVTLEHPSLSRHHAVVQFCSQASDKHECGWYLYDLDSTHGTWINKTKIVPKVYHRLKVGHMIKFGGSSRLFILQGPSADTEEESELTITEMKEQRERQKREVEVLRLAELEENERKLAEHEKRREASGCSWGMDEDDIVEETVENPFSAPDNEDLYINDPKKSLKGYFEREGLDPPQYEISEAGFGKYKCQVELPIDTPTGQPVIAEVIVSGKKKEAVVECALEACRIIDRHGLLRNATHESRKRKQKNWEEDDFYDSDEDTFLDRTGDIEKKRSLRMQKAGKLENKAQSYDSLMSQHKEVLAEMEEIEAKLEKAKRDSEAAEASDIDALDAYMMSIKSGAMDTKTKMKLKCRQLELRKEEARLRKLINIAKPASLPEFKKTGPAITKPVDQKGLPTIGKRRMVESVKIKKAVPLKAEHLETPDSFVEEEDEDEEIETDTDESARPSADCTVTSSDYKSFLSESSLPPTDTVTSPDSTVQPLENTVRSGDNSSEHTSVTSAEAKVYTAPSIASNRTAEKTEESRSKIPEISSSHSANTGKPGGVKDKTKFSKQGIVKKKVSEDSGVEYDSEDPNYAVWLPPVGQSGDGKTHLNEKYGY